MLHMVKRKQPLSSLVYMCGTWWQQCLSKSENSDLLLVNNMTHICDNIFSMDFENAGIQFKLTKLYPFLSLAI